MGCGSQGGQDLCAPRVFRQSLRRWAHGPGVQMTASGSAFDEGRLAHLQRVIADDIAAGLYYGAVIAFARGGSVGLHAAIGHADAKKTIPLRLDSVFSIFSVTKAITNVLVLR